MLHTHIDKQSIRVRGKSKKETVSHIHFQGPMICHIQPKHGSFNHCTIPYHIIISCPLKTIDLKNDN